jgi:hypothetical protein
MFSRRLKQSRAEALLGMTAAPPQQIGDAALPSAHISAFC